MINIDAMLHNADWPKVLRSRRFLANPYHEPAGSSKGGEFAHAPGSSWPIDDGTVRHKLARTGVTKLYDSWKNGLTPEQREIVTAYTRGAYAEMNHYLREPWDAPEGTPVLKKIAQLKQTLDTAPPPPKDLLVWRGIDPRAVEDVDVGDVLTLNGFQSASLDPHLAATFRAKASLLMEIKPISGAYIHSMSAYKTHGGKHNKIPEYEFLIPHGAQYRVMGFKKLPVSQWSNGQDPVTRTVVQLEQLTRGGS